MRQTGGVVFLTDGRDNRQRCTGGARSVSGNADTARDNHHSATTIFGAEDVI